MARMKQEVIILRIQSQLKEEFIKALAEDGENMSEVVRYWIKKYLEERREREEFEAQAKL